VARRTWCGPGKWAGELSGPGKPSENGDQSNKTMRNHRENIGNHRRLLI